MIRFILLFLFFSTARAFSASDFNSENPVCNPYLVYTSSNDVPRSYYYSVINPDDAGMLNETECAEYATYSGKPFSDAISSQASNQWGNYPRGCQTDSTNVYWNPSTTSTANCEDAGNSCVMWRNPEFVYSGTPTTLLDTYPQPEGMYSLTAEHCEVFGTLREEVGNQWKGITNTAGFVSGCTNGIYYNTRYDSTKTCSVGSGRACIQQCYPANYVTCERMEVKSGQQEVMQVDSPAGYYSISKAECKEYADSLGKSMYEATSTSYPPGCSYYYTSFLYWNDNLESTYSCSTSRKCQRKCYDKVGCDIPLATNYDPVVDYPVRDTCILPVTTTIKTCTDITDEGIWCYGDEHALNKEYAVIEKDPIMSCSATPDVNGVIDLSGVDTQGRRIYIGYRAFKECESLTSITLGSHEIEYGYEALYKAKLTSVTISDTARINYAAFYQNDITSVTLPSELTYLGDHAFNGNQLTSITIPSGLTYLGKAAFVNNQLTSITIPNGVTEIQDFTFQSNALTSVTLHDGITLIDEYAFYQNPFTSIVLPNSLTTIGSKAFEGTGLTSITIPGTMTAIVSNAFQNSNDLETLILNEGLLTIESSAFTGTKITSITIPSTVTNFQSSSFTNSDSSVKIEFTFQSDSITVDNNKYIFPTSDLNDFSCSEISDQVTNQMTDCSINTDPVTLDTFSCGELKTEFNEESRNCDCV